MDTTPGSTLDRMPCTSWGCATLLVLDENVVTVPPSLRSTAAVTPAPTPAPTTEATMPPASHRGARLPPPAWGADGVSGGGGAGDDSKGGARRSSSLASQGGANVVALRSSTR